MINLGNWSSYKHWIWLNVHAPSMKFWYSWAWDWGTASQSGREYHSLIAVDRSGCTTFIHHRETRLFFKSYHLFSMILQQFICCSHISFVQKFRSQLKSFRKAFANEFAYFQSEFFALSLTRYLETRNDSIYQELDPSKLC